MRFDCQEGYKGGERAVRCGAVHATRLVDETANLLEVNLGDIAGGLGAEHLELRAGRQQTLLLVRVERDVADVTRTTANEKRSC